MVIIGQCVLQKMEKKFNSTFLHILIRLLLQLLQLVYSKSYITDVDETIP